MTSRRTVAPDIAGCSFGLYAMALFFPVLRAPFIHKSVALAARDLAIFGGLLALCLVIAAALFARRAWVLAPAVLLSLAMFAASVAGWNIPDTVQLPAGVLACASAVLLVARRQEFMAGGADEETAGDSPGDSPGDSDD